jgi:hypothetical protein
MQHLMPGEIDNTQERQFVAHITEYEKLRDEALQRVVLQNNNVQHALIATGIVGALLGTLYPTNQGRVSMDTFWWVAACICFVYALLIELLIGNWVYQTAMMFQIGIYQTWRKTKHLSGLVSDASTLFRWEDNRPQDPWLQILGRGQQLGLLQVGFLYGLVAVAWCSSAVLLIHDVADGNILRWGLVAVFELVVLIVFVVLARAHTQIHVHLREQLDKVRNAGTAGECTE